jgi:hypothetical protein
MVFTKLVSIYVLPFAKPFFEPTIAMLQAISS